MATDVTMPKLSDTMTEGVLIQWRKNVGQRVERGEIIAEVETDKANMELESFTSGVLLETRVNPGDNVPVGAVIAVIGEAGEKPEKAGEEKPVPEEPEKGPAAPSVPPEAKEPPAREAPPPPSPERERPPEKTAEESGKEEELRRETGLEELGEGVTAGTKPEAAQVAPPPTEVSGEAPVQAPAVGEKASPLVRRLAREKGVDLAQVQGSGPEGRILQQDLARLEKPAGAAAPGPEKEKPGPPGAAPQPLSRMRGAIARVVAEAWRTIPHFAVTMAIDMGEVERVRQELKEAGVSCSLNDFIVKAAALAIGKFPMMNASFTGEGIVHHQEVNIGIAVALEDGLLIPVIKGCQGLSLKELAARSREIIDRARSGKAAEDDLKGGTFSISNMGKYGVEQFMAVIYPTQAGILAVGGVIDQPVIRGGHLTAARIMRVTLSGDHRLIDGAYAAQFLQELKRVLESPVQMLL